MKLSIEYNPGANQKYRVCENKCPNNMVYACRRQFVTKLEHYYEDEMTIKICF